MIACTLKALTVCQALYYAGVSKLFLFKRSDSKYCRLYGPTDKIEGIV